MFDVINCFADVTSNYDVAFLCGDLNFRLNKSREEVLDIVSKGWGDNSSIDVQRELLPLLLETDQLKYSFGNSKKRKDPVN